MKRVGSASAEFPFSDMLAERAGVMLPGTDDLVLGCMDRGSMKPLEKLASAESYFARDRNIRKQTLMFEGMAIDVPGVPKWSVDRRLRVDVTEKRGRQYRHDLCDQTPFQPLTAGHSGGRSLRPRKG